MNKNARKWIADLRAHPELQGRHVLANAEMTEFCCLGRACVLFLDENPEKLKVTHLPRSDSSPSITLFGHSGYVLGEQVRAWLGLRTNRGLIKDKSTKSFNMEDSLTVRNDTGQTFPQIADAIEQFEDILFLREEETQNVEPLRS